MSTITKVHSNKLVKEHDVVNYYFEEKDPEVRAENHKILRLNYPKTEDVFLKECGLSENKPAKIFIEQIQKRGNGYHYVEDIFADTLHKCKIENINSHTALNLIKISPKVLLQLNIYINQGFIYYDQKIGTLYIRKARTRSEFPDYNLIPKGLNKIIIE